MLYIMTSVHAEGKASQWYIGEKCPISPNTVQYVTEVQANGDELEYILQVSRNLPECTAQNPKGIPWVQHWYGDHAKWIVGNLIR